jgi:hypothetical protein
LLSSKFWLIGEWSISEKIGGLVNKLRLQRVSQDQAKVIAKRHNTPENVQLRLPKCDQVFGMKFPARHALQTLNFSQHAQAALLGSINCQLEATTNSLLSANVSKDVLNSCLDGITLAMTANYELNQRRRDAIRPQFKAEFAKGLCSTTSPADEFLFGGDTTKRVKEMAEFNKHKVCKGSTSFRGRGPIFHPYATRGFRGGSMGGRSQRGQAKVLSLVLVFISARNFRMCPSTSERQATKSPLATGMLTY